MELVSQLVDGIGWVTLNRPKLRNAISKLMWDALPTVLSSLKTGGARVVVFAGEGLAFASGADLAELDMLDTPDKARDHWLSIRNALNAVASFDLPTVAMIHGPCMGGGCLLACACDMRICEPGAAFCIPVAHLGIVLDEDNIARLINLVGRGWAAELLLTGATIDADRAERIGLVNRVVPAHKLRETVVSIADAIRNNVADAVMQTKRSIVSLDNRIISDQDQEPIVSSYLSDEFRQRLSKALAKGDD